MAIPAANPDLPIGGERVARIVSRYHSGHVASEPVHPSQESKVVCEAGERLTPSPANLVAICAIRRGCHASVRRPLLELEPILLDRHALSHELGLNCQPIWQCRQSSRHGSAVKSRASTAASAHSGCNGHASPPTRDRPRQRSRVLCDSPSPSPSPSACACAISRWLRPGHA